MRCRTAKLISIFAVITMMIVPAAVIIDNTNDSTADDPVDYTKYYGNQLSGMSKAIYDTVVAMTDTGGDYIEASFPADMAWFTKAGGKLTKDAADEQLGEASKMAQKALINDNPICGIWLDLNNGIQTKYSASSIDDDLTINQITVKAIKYSSYSASVPTSTVMINNVNHIMENIGITAVSTTNPLTKDLVKTVHDWVANRITYPTGTEMSGQFVRNLWNAVGTTDSGADNKAVCEGYAKAFKMACDTYNIPCIIVTGEANNGEKTEGHMWNYVLMPNDYWYLVDCTWDDQLTTSDKYLLAGTDTMGFVKAVKDSHSTKLLTDMGFTVPALSAVAFGDPAQMYLTTFEWSKTDSKVYKTSYTQVNHTITAPDTPIMDGYIFKKWLNKADDSAWDFSTPVTGDVILYGDWEKIAPGDVVITIKFKSNGAAETISSIQGIAGKTITLPTSVLTRDDGYEHVGWGTSENGGFIFELGADIISDKDLTLYAAWEETEDHSPYKIDSTVETAGEFLSQETIPGVSNTNLTIAVVAGVIALLALILIARKK